MDDAEREVFLAAIPAAPNEPTPRLVYTDWLDERGETEGELVRLLCEIQAAEYRDEPAWERFESLTGGVAREIGRLERRSRWLLLCDCAERVLPLFERKFSNDARPRRAIEAGRLHASGRIPRLELTEPMDGRSTTVSTAASTAADAAAVIAAITEQSDAAAAAYFAAAAAVGDTDSILSHNRHPFTARRESCWLLCRAVEYRLGFVPPPRFDHE